jgi:hypothetical protein
LRDFLVDILRDPLRTPVVEQLDLRATRFF